MTETFWGILIPFLGTSLGAACVFFMRRALGDLVQRSLAGFAAGVMVAASVWSLLIPAIEQSEKLGRFAFFPAFAGFWFGVLFLLALDHLIPHLHVGSEEAEGPKSRLGRTTMMVLAVTLHNIPEGMAVGVMYAGFLAGSAQITAARCRIHASAPAPHVGCGHCTRPVHLPISSQTVRRRSSRWRTSRKNTPGAHDKAAKTPHTGHKIQTDQADETGLCPGEVFP